MRTDKEVPQKYIWEGKILNKISKKIVALVTMAAFATTLVPAAAFAAPGDALAEYSTYEVKSEAAGALDITVNLNQADGVAATAFANDKVFVTVTDAEGNNPQSATPDATEPVTGAIGYPDFVSLKTTGLTPNDDVVELSYTDVTPGEYTVVVYYGDDASADERLAPRGGQAVTVYDNGVDPSKTSVQSANITTNGFAIDVNLASHFGGNVDLRGTNVKVEVDGLTAGAEVAATGATVTTAADLATTGVTPTGAHSVYTFSGVAAGTYPVTVTVDDQEYELSVVVPEAAAANQSRLLIDNTADAADATEDKAVEVEFDLVGGNEAIKAGDDLYVWAADKNGHIVDVIDVDGVKDADGIYITEAEEDAAGVYVVTKADGTAIVDGDKINVTFTNDGTYTLYAGIGADFTAAQVHELAPITVTVAPKAFTTDRINIIDVDEEDDEIVVAGGAEIAEKTTGWTYTINDNVTPNGKKTYTVNGVALDENGDPAENETLKITCQNAGLELDKAEVTTNAKGEFEFTFKLNDTGVFYITVAEANNDAFARIAVSQDAMAPVSISTAKDGGLMLAGTDDQYVYNQYRFFNDAVQFNIVDAYGRDATGDEVLALVAAADDQNPNRVDFIEVDAPEGSKLTDADVVLDWNNGAYTLRYIGEDPVHDLIPGEYTVSVSLNNGVDATATFTLAEFQGAESLAVDLVAADNDIFFVDDANNDAITAIDDQVALGQYVGGTVYLVDEQGLKVVAPATNLSVGVKGAAVDMKTVDLNNPFGFKTFDNTPANQSVIGSVITISAYDEVNKIYTEKELTVVSNYLEETLAFDPVQGPVGENNAVEISVVDKDGKVSKVNGTVTAYVESQSNEEATVELKANETVTDGVGRLYLESDAAGTADVVVAVKATNGEVYAATLTYTFGDEAAADGRYIVMTIGSEQYLINNEIFDGSVDKLGAPYIDDAWRTMVPVRVLAETLGAKVEYADNVVTVVDGDTTVEMTIGEKAYTINGEAAETEMDTVPVIGDGDRTYVPIRFLTNALGYEVNPLYNAEGLTSSVHFTK